MPGFIPGNQTCLRPSMDRRVKPGDDDMGIVSHEAPWRHGGVAAWRRGAIAGEAPFVTGKKMPAFADMTI